MVAAEERRSGAPGAVADPAGIDLSLVHDDPAFHLQRRLGLIPREGMGTLRRALIFGAICWLPIVVWAMLTGRVSRGAEGDTLLAHFGVHVRCLVAIPMLVIAEGVAQKMVPPLLRYFFGAGLVTAETLPQFRTLIASIARLRNLSLPWVLIAGAVIAWTTAGAFLKQIDDVIWPGGPGDMAGALTFGGWWFILVVRPLFTALLLAWLWRACLVFVLFLKLSRFPLALAPVHPDRVAGLGFVERLMFIFSPVAFSLSAVVAASFAHDVMYHGVNVTDIKGELIATTVMLIVIFLIPFMPLAVTLGRVKRDAIFSYGSLVGRHARLVHRRWILKEDVGTPDILDAPELGPVADVQAVYQAIRSMRGIPVGKLGLIAIVVPAAVPMLVVAGMQLPLQSVLTKVLKTLL
ncbi:hypothetical protein E2553_05310 [Paraburkholderia dipogonis]|uniref:Uncharacterized protein n=1 Tax=Paraburkholderia dipogonis TaxID=1211383 RepID=A0A4Y8N495_9BURK|nr:hypothetical protein [Paraburkholderia dipogonis]TFE44495.1 hypothetical protein E2553_05310 [Paraburkholderia dipogonis]